MGGARAPPSANRAGTRQSGGGSRIALAQRARGARALRVTCGMREVAKEGAKDWATDCHVIDRVLAMTRL